MIDNVNFASIYDVGHEFRLLLEDHDIRGVARLVKELAELDYTAEKEKLGRRTRNVWEASRDGDTSPVMRRG